MKFIKKRDVALLVLVLLVGRYCFTGNRHVENLTRHYRSESAQFEVSSPLVVHGETRSRVERHSFKVMPTRVLQGSILSVRQSRYNQYGQDVILHYQDVSDAANGSKAVILFGADEAVSKQLRTDFLAIFAQPGKPFRIEGALLSFQSSTWDGSSWFSVDQADDVFLPISPRDPLV